MWSMVAAVLNTRWKVGLVAIVVFFFLWEVGTRVNRWDGRIIPAFLAFTVALWLYRKVRRATRRSNSAAPVNPARADNIV